MLALNMFPVTDSLHRHDWLTVEKAEWIHTAIYMYAGCTGLWNKYKYYKLFGTNGIKNYFKLL